MTDADLADRLRRAIAGADAGWAAQPSRLRRALVDEFGPDGDRYRSQLHQLVTAADENIPVRLRRMGWSPEARDELAAALMAARGWNEAAATWTVTTWAAALDLIDPTPARPATGFADPVPTTIATELAPTHVDPDTDMATDTADRTGSTTDSTFGRGT